MFSVSGEKPNREVLYGGEIFAKEVDGKFELSGGFTDEVSRSVYNGALALPAAMWNIPRQIYRYFLTPEQLLEAKNRDEEVLQARLRAERERMILDARVARTAAMRQELRELPRFRPARPRPAMALPAINPAMGAVDPAMPARMPRARF